MRLVLLLLALAACSKAPTPVATLDAAPAAPPPPPAATVTIAAAANLTAAFEEVGKTFTVKSGQKVEFVFGASGQLAQKIQEGAPYDLMASADVGFVDKLIASGDCLADSKAIYGRGRIVLWGKAGGAISKESRLADLTDKKFVKIAIANPETAPYGKAARQALEKQKLWTELEPKIVYAENIKQTLQFAQTGNVEAAITALPLAIVEKDGAYAGIPEDQHEPLDQALAVCKHGKNPDGAKAFAAFLASPEGKAILDKFGYAQPAASP